MITIDSSNNTLAGIRDAINSSGGPVTASIVNDGSGASPYRLVLTSNETGDDADITHDIASVLTLTNDAALNADSSNTAQDAQVTINGLAIYSESNTFVDAIDDVTFEISQVETDTPLTLTISDDFTTPISTISSFIASYNLVLAEFSAAFDTDDTTGASTGTLSSDISVQIAQNRLANIMTNVHYELAGNAFQSLAEIGITMNDDGLLDVDTDVLEDALTEDADSVKRLFQGMSSSVDGIADQAYDVLYDLTNSADGVFTRKSRIWDETIDDLLDLMEEREDRIETYEELVRSKFNYLEELLSTLEAQSSALEGLQSVLDSSNS
ncbi:MAG: flagellar filament capping protein FliD [Deltaproteobacteria bacterium]|nr:flagellar filament capping protein FliD [Deltaproteobacteria bacterium]